MSVHIGRAVSEVVAAPEPASSGQPAAAREGWAEADRRRREAAHAERDRERTRAEGFDD
jgi:hypothetical protein